MTGSAYQRNPHRDEPAPETPASAGDAPSAAAGAQTVFVVRDQRGCFWGKGRDWVDGREPKQVARFRYRDEAVNTLFELSSKDVTLRGTVVSASTGARGEPSLAPGCLYPPSEADTGPDAGPGTGDGAGAGPPNAGT